jgi:predicted Rossmann fold nucleotide-binding protein DprA/Smf involved in DNA uptake
MKSPSRGAAGADLLTRVIAEIVARRDSLFAAVQEYEQLLGAVDALGEQEPVAPITPPRVAVRSAPAVVKAKPKVKAPTRFKAPAKVPTVAKHKAPAEPGEQVSETPASTVTEQETGQAVLAALEHGSHTVAELVVVTAIPAPSIRDALKLLSKAAKVKRTAREGKAAYALTGG